jgi:cell division protein FtsN
MSRDFAKKPRGGKSRSNTSSGTPTWLWFVLGLILGAFGTSFYFIKNPVIAPPPKAEEKPKKVENNTPKPRFDFYKLLQESETIVPASETTSEDKPVETQTNVEYIIQVGSFPKPEDADKLRAQLILLNLDARVERVEIRKSEIWHRVVVGPFATQNALTNARAQLVKNEYNALVLKRDKTKH